MPMKVFISDLHLGDGSRTDDFHRDKEFLGFLEFVAEEAAELIILGDLLELWQADLDRVLFRHSAVINKLLAIGNKVKLTYVVGNHDYIPLVKFARAGGAISLEYHDAENGIIAEHGHKYDIFNRYKNPLQSIKWPSGKYFTLLVAGLERLIHPDVDSWTRKALEGVDDFLQRVMLVRNKIPPSTPEYLKKGGHFGEFEQAVKNHLRCGKRIVVFGHIHQAQLETKDTGIYANCGSWVDKVEPSYIACYVDRIELKEALTHKIIKQLALNRTENRKANRDNGQE